MGQGDSCCILRQRPCSTALWSAGFLTQTHSVAHIDHMQIKEPEGYVDKSKRQQDGKRRRTHEDKTRSITDFFKGVGAHRLGSTDAAGPSSQPGAVLLPCSPL